MNDVYFTLSNVYIARDYCLETENALRKSVYGMGEVSDHLEEECTSFSDYARGIMIRLQNHVSDVRSKIHSLEEKASRAEAKKKQPLPPPSPPTIPANSPPEKQQAAFSAYKQKVAEVNQKNRAIEEENQRIDRYIGKCNEAIRRLEGVLSRLSGLESAARSNADTAVFAARENMQQARNAVSQGSRLISAMGEFSSAFLQAVDTAQKISDFSPSPVRGTSYMGREFSIRNTHEHRTSGSVFSAASADFSGSLYGSDTERARQTGGEFAVREKSADTFWTTIEGSSRFKMPSANLHRLGGKALLAELEARGYSLVKQKSGSVIDENGWMHWEKNDE